MRIPHHRRPRSLGDYLCRALATSFAFAIGLEAFILTSVDGHAPESGIAVGQTERPAGVAGRLMQKFDCSTVGFENSATPRSAIVRRADGRVRLVSFEKGWAVHTAHGEAALVAVCLAPLPQRAS